MKLGWHHVNTSLTALCCQGFFVLIAMRKGTQQEIKEHGNEKKA
ncbi:MAG: hypothetical protein PUD10_04720 [Lachnospira sp.]|nr:hypothetical protein [Lachnospira sp.]